MAVPFQNLALQHRLLRNELAEAIERVMASASFILGPDVQSFEEEFARYIGAKHCIGVSTGTDALILAFKALDLTPNDEVIIPAHTFVATAIGVLHAGSKPVLVDVDPVNGLLDPDLVERAVTPRTKAICPVHLHGRTCEMARITEIASRYGLAIIEDAAQAHGARCGGRAAGTWGAMGCFSFYPAKNLGACGDGGAIVTDSPELAARLRRMRNYGSEEKYSYPEWGRNARLDTLQAAILRVKLQKLEQWNRRRYHVAALYSALLSEPPIPGLTVPAIPEFGSHVFQLYVIQHVERDALRSWLSSHGIETGIHHPKPFYLEPAYARLGYVPGSFPVAEALAHRVLSLPLFPEITDDEVHEVVQRIREFPGNG